MKKTIITLSQIIILAVTYFIMARLALLLAIPPGFAAPVWPAAGLALAGGLVFGYRALPGVFLGSMAANIYVAADTLSAGFDAKALLVAACIALGAALQAVFGTFLVKHASGISMQLSNIASVGKLMIYGGAIACVVNAVIGPFMLYVNGVLSSSELVMNMCVWWVGDVIGVLLFAPMFVVLANRYVSALRKILVVVPVMLFTAVAIFAFTTSKNTQKALHQNTFEKKAGIIAVELEKEIEVYKSVLTAAQQFINSSEEVTSKEFEFFAAEFIWDYPGIRSIQWGKKVYHKNRDEYERNIRAQGFPDFVIKDRIDAGIIEPADARDVYFPITYLYPLAGNEAAHGFDVYGPDILTSDLRRAILDKARDTGQAMATRRISLVQDEGTYGLVIYNPVYAHGRDTGSVAARRKHHIGYTSGVFTMPSMLTNIAHKAWQDNMDMILHNVLEGQEKELLYDSRTPDYKEPVTPIKISDTAAQFRVEIDMAGQKWVLTLVERNQAAGQGQNWYLWIVLVGGLMCSAVLGGFVIILSANTERMGKEIRKEGGTVTKAAVVSLVIAGISFVFSFAVWVEYNKREAHLIGQIAQEEITHTTSNIIENVTTAVMALERMAARWGARGGTPFKEWEIDAQSLIDDYTALTTVEWADKSYHIKWVEPLAGNEKAVGLNIVFNEERQKALEGAAERDQPTLTPPIDLVQGYRGLIAYVPLMVDESFDGFIVGIYDLQAFLTNIMPQHLRESFYIRIIDQNKEVYNNVEPMAMPNSAFTYRTEFKIFDRDWVFMARAKPAYYGKHKSSYSYFSLLGGILLSILIGISVYTVIISYRRNILLQKSEYALKEANEELEEFAYRTSHDLRSPIVSSLALSKMLEKHIADNNAEKAEECLHMIVNALSKLQDLIEDILSLAKTKNEKESYEEVDLSEMVATTLAKLKGMDGFSSVDFRENLEIRYLSGILKNRLKLVVSNLLSNAYKYTDPSRETSYISVHSYRYGDNLYIDFEDNGLGIPEGNRDQIFQMFKRFHPKASYGSGLGLYMIKKSAEMLGGDIIYIPQKQGSIFRLILPDGKA
ncbi:MAG: CHASE domain-containing protein [Alphaproteobacteria bacterium]|nr:CHASE domain-containing protein [Alphaproteobacteria bacterium]